MKKIFFVILSFAILFTGCGSNSNKSENEIIVYTSIEDEFIQDYIDKFNEEYPDIKVNIIRDSTGVIAAKLLAEKDNPQADVVWSVAVTSLSQLDKQNCLEGYRPEGLEKISKKFVDSKNNDPHWTGLSAWTGIFTVNEEEIKSKGLKVPSSYEDLLNDEYKNEVIMPNPASSGTGFLLISGWIQDMGEKEAWEYMDKLHENMKTYVHSGAAPIRNAASGEVCIGLGMDGESLLMEKQSPQVKTVFPTDNLGWDLDAVSLIKKDNIKSEAKTFIDWTISKEAMELYSRHKIIVTSDECKSKLTGYPLNIMDKLVENDFEWMVENKERIIEEWNRRYASKE